LEARANFRRNIILLSVAQGLLLCNGVTMITISGLLGYELAVDKRLATLPVTSYVIGTTLTTLPAAWFMKLYGRRAGFMLGALLGICGGLVCALAVYMQSFWLLALGTMFAGSYNAFGQQYRFAAADMVPPDWKAKAISFTLAGGILGGILGPETGKLTRDLMSIPFMASCVTLSGYAIIALLIASRLTIPPPAADLAQAPGRPLKQLLRQPALIVAITVAALSYGTMNLLMSATPLAMSICQHSFADTALVFEWHVIGMFAPGFFTGSLIKRFGVLRVMLAGAVAMFACVAIDLVGQTLLHFWASLFLLGVGWNFLFVGATTLLTETYSASEKGKVQGTNDFIVFATQGISSLVAGAILVRQGWSVLNQFALPMIIIATLASAWLLIHRSRAAAAS